MSDVASISFDLSRGGPSPVLVPRGLLRPASELLGVPRGGLFPASPAIFRWLEGRFASGRVTRLVGSPNLVPGFLSFLLAAVATSERTVSLRDGANRVAPYAMASLGRRWGASAEDLLPRIRLARAFTAHQMVTLIETWVEDEAEETRAADLLVASGPATLFAEEDVMPYERDALLPYVASLLQQLVRSVDRPLLIVEGSDEPLPWDSRGPPPEETLEVASRTDGRVFLTAERSRDSLELVTLAPHQHHMEEYELDPARAGGGVERWDGPSLRTGRRSI